MSRREKKRRMRRSSNLPGFLVTGVASMAIGGSDGRDDEEVGDTPPAGEVESESIDAGIKLNPPTGQAVGEKEKAPVPSRLFEAMKQIRASFPLAETNEVFIENPQLYRANLNLVDQFVDDESMLTHLIKSYKLDAVVALLESGLDPNIPNKKGVMAISTAAHKGNVTILKALIEAGADVNALNSSGSSALIQASHFGHQEIVEILLEHNAISDFANSNGTTALMRASQEGRLEISDALIKAGADVNRKNNEGMNALMLASQRGHSHMCTLLVKHGASIDNQTAQGSTALMLACKRGHMSCVEILVAMGAEIYIRDCRNRIARDTAMRRSHFHLLPILDTQYQVKKVQQHRREYRDELLLSLKLMFDRHRLKLASVNLIGDNSSKTISSTLSYIDVMSKLSSDFTHLENPLNLLQNVVRPHPVGFEPPGYIPSQWPLLLFKFMYLPDEAFHLIVSFLPSPRLWQWSLPRLKKRSQLSAKQALIDTSVIIDEVLSDSCIFSNGDSEYLLTKLIRQPTIYPLLISHWNMSPSLVESLYTWADVQSLLNRVAGNEISFKSTFAKRFIDVANKLVMWYRSRVSSRNLEFVVHAENGNDAKLFYARTPIGSIDRDGDENVGEDDNIDQETETEQPLDGQQDDESDDDAN